MKAYTPFTVNSQLDLTPLFWVPPMCPTVKEALSQGISFNPGNSNSIFKDEGIKAKTDSAVRVIKSKQDSKLNQSFFISHCSIFFFLARVPSDTLHTEEKACIT